MTEHFTNIKDILSGVEFSSVRPVFAKVVADWADIVGKKFADKSEPVEIFSKGIRLCLIVHVKSSPIVQELGFFKQNILKKIKDRYSVEIQDIIIKPAPKNTLQKQTVKQTQVQEIYSERPSDEELNKINIDESILIPIKESVENQTALSSEQKDRMLSVIINDLKTQEWMKQKGFPVCKKCGRVMTGKIFGEEDICHICKNSN